MTRLWIHKNPLVYPIVTKDRLKKSLETIPIQFYSLR